MPSRVSLAALLLLGCSNAAPSAPVLAPTATPQANAAPAALPPEAGDAQGPRGTSGAPDEIGFATWYGEELGGSKTASGAPFDPAAITAAHRTLPLGSYAEVTALDTGRTILLLINDRGPADKSRAIDLSRGAAALLGTGTNPMAPVRIRAAVASRDDAAALAAGRAAAPRLDAPPSLLAILRRRLPASSRVASPAVAPVARPGIPIVAGRAFIVQVAAFSDAGRAKALATRIDGRVESSAGVHRVRLGPFTDAAAARRARDAAAKHGYGDAAIIVQP